MSLQSFSRSLVPASAQSTPPPPPPPPPCTHELIALFDNRIAFRALLLAAAVVICLLTGHVADAATINVNSTCSLSNAIKSANQDSSVGGCTAGSGGDRIELSANYFMTSTPLPDITSEITIDGNGYGMVGGRKYAGFNVTSGADFTVVDIQMKQFLGTCTQAGAAIDASGATLTIRNSFITDSYGGDCGLYGYGAVLAVNSDITITSSRFVGNGSDSTGRAYGLAVAVIANNSNLVNASVDYSLFSGNKAYRQAGAGSGGGAIYLLGTGGIAPRC